jgi:RNA polymerase sigma factor (sigma-70 family)
VGLFRGIVLIHLSARDRHKKEKTLFVNEMCIEAEISKYYKQMYAVALSLCRNTHDAEDIVQDVVLKALRAKDGYTEEGKGKHYLLFAVKNAFINEYRYGKMKKRRIGSRVELEEAYQVADPITINHKTKRHIDQKILDAIAGVSPDERLPFLLSNAYDYQYEEIARICNIPMGTVRSRIHRAKLQLQSQLAK